MKRLIVTALAVSTLGLMQPATAAPDTLTGTSGNDKLVGGNGPDVIRGMAGNDKLFGGKGPDRVYGGPGNDSVWTGKGGSGKGDAGYGGRGNDVVHNFGSGQTAGVTSGGPGFDRCIVNQHDVSAGLVTGCEVVEVR